VVMVVGQDSLQLVVRRAGTGKLRMPNDSSIR